MKKFGIYLLLVFAAPVGAQQYPDSRAYCQSIVGESYSLVEFCMQREWDAYQRVTASRHKVTAQIWNYCWRIVGYSWPLLEFCIKRELAAKERLR